MTFDDTINCEYCCDNCINNRGKTGHVLVFDTHNVTSKLGMMYVDTAKYSDVLLSSKC